MHDSTQSELLWARNAPATVAWSEDGRVLFDPASGETHFLADLPALLVTAVTKQPAGVGELIERLAGDVALDDREWGKIESALQMLERAELVQSSTV